MLTIESLTYHLKGRTLFDNASFTLNSGEKVGLVGRNGIGKTTLFRLIKGEIEPDNGLIRLQNGTKIGSLPQMPPQSEQPAIDLVVESDEAYRALMTELATTTDMDRLGEIQFELESIDAFTAEARAAKVLAGLGFSEEKQKMPVNTFSGGWRMRIALASVLFNKPDLMLLDEPSNHLDLETTFWLMEYLKKSPCALILISHDKYVLNHIADRIVHLHQKNLTSYTGNYDHFIEAKFLTQIQQQAAFQKQQAKKEHVEKFVNRFRAKASKAKQVQSRIKMLEKMQDIQMMQDDPTLGIHFPEPIELAPPLVTLESVSVGYGDTIVLKNLNQRIDPDDCIALVGRNGNGKSTFAKLIADKLKPIKGKRRVEQKFSVAFFNQEQLENLTLTKTAYQHMEELMPHAAPTNIRALLGQFGLTQTKSDTLVGQLSGGEKTRLNFAMLSVEKPGLLILDEPTNHLDIESREALVLSINQFNGAVILITHDWDLLKMTASTLWVAENGTVQNYDGTLESYRDQALGSKADKNLQAKERAHQIKTKKMNKKKK
ncbi:MAG: glycosyl transferase family 1 [Rickettsiales bacterium]|nr:glycosyl transferase family 1 [Rickettsiales bacterium]|tara:strand:+ start:38656 stop:40290 length:1635 start_codon:yes stop_codon:yes gene_type:complete